jgi:hypothetical protein
MTHKNGIENVILQLQKRNKNGTIRFHDYYQSQYEAQKYMLQCLQSTKNAFMQCKHCCKERRKNKREKRKWIDDRTLIKSNHTYLNLIFCGPEWRDKKWHSLGSYGYMQPPMFMQSLLYIWTNAKG